MQACGQAADGAELASMTKGAAEAAQFNVQHQPTAQFIVGMTNSAPSLTPDGQREVTVLVLV